MPFNFAFFCILKLKILLNTLYSILIIDDEPNNVELISSLLNKYATFPFKLWVAHTVDKANDILGNITFNIVFSDYKLPKMVGTSLINSLTHKQTQFVLCTAYAYKKFENDFEKPVYFLQKPIDIDIFKTMLTHIYQTITAYEKDLIL